LNFSQKRRKKIDSKSKKLEIDYRTRELNNFEEVLKKSSTLTKTFLDSTGHQDKRIQRLVGCYRLYIKLMYYPFYF